MSAAQIAESRQLARAKHFPPGSEDQDELPKSSDRAHQLSEPALISNKRPRPRRKVVS